jgi:uncharacterized protein (DUF2236 family)
MVFGELDDALFAARRVHQIHTRIHGTIPIDVGAWRAGTPYHANDADSLRWVHATLVDTTMVVREKLDGPLPTERKDAYMVEMNRFAALFGIPRALLPTSWADHASYMASMIPRLAVAPVAREMAAFLMGRTGAVQPPLGRLVEALSASLLPRDLAAAFELRSSRLPVGALLAALAPVYRRLPSRVVAIPARSAAKRRLAGLPPSRLSAWTERQLFGLSRQVTGI